MRPSPTSLRVSEAFCVEKDNQICRQVGSTGGFEAQSPRLDYLRTEIFSDSPDFLPGLGNSLRVD